MRRFYYQPMKKHTLNTPRLYLRGFMPQDAGDLLAYLACPRSNCFLDEKLSSLEAAKQSIAQRSQDPLQLALVLKEEQTVIGHVFARKESPDTYSVGWCLNARYEGNGYAFEAACAYLSFLFFSQNARRVYAYVQEGNTRSQKLCEKLGFRREGLFKEFISFITSPDGSPVYENTLQYAILKKEWEKIHNMEIAQAE